MSGIAYILKDGKTVQHHLSSIQKKETLHICFKIENTIKINSNSIFGITLNGDIIVVHYPDFSDKSIQIANEYFDNMYRSNQKIWKGFLSIGILVVSLLYLPVFIL